MTGGRRETGSAAGSGRKSAVSTLMECTTSRSASQPFADQQIARETGYGDETRALSLHLSATVAKNPAAQRPAAELLVGRRRIVSV